MKINLFRYNLSVANLKKLFTWSDCFHVIDELLNVSVLLVSLLVLPRRAKMKGPAFQVIKMTSLNASVRKASPENIA